jgi:hypothetical protein
LELKIEGTYILGWREILKNNFEKLVRNEEDKRMEISKEQQIKRSKELSLH